MYLAHEWCRGSGIHALESLSLHPLRCPPYVREQLLADPGPHIVVDCSFAPAHCKPGVESRSLAKQVSIAPTFYVF